MAGHAIKTDCVAVDIVVVFVLPVQVTVTVEVDSTVLELT